ncbi:ATP phosphoribosyltransferase regulatory subunit [Desulfitobacterium hafniense]|nr:ATP phosphoribosyltransferase regulatory subunit [Desulfitobacterium hafniense]
MDIFKVFSHSGIASTWMAFYFLGKGLIIMKSGTVKGASDFLPKDVSLRDFIQGSILETYKANGFERIMTPALEDIDNLAKIIREVELLAEDNYAIEFDLSLVRGQG